MQFLGKSLFKEVLMIRYFTSNLYQEESENDISRFFRPIFIADNNRTFKKIDENTDKILFS